jgi:1-acyl-sn-glycerol-3-phosphate acyltransferase
MIRSAYTFLGYYFTLAMFGACGLGLSLFSMMAGVLPVTTGTERFFQRLIHRHFALFVWWTTKARLFGVRYHGLERLPRGRRGLVLVANHPGLTDITVLLARLPEAVCIFKPAIRRNPVLGAAARRAGYLASDGGHEVVRRAAEKVSAGHTVIIFPEGTRTRPGTAVLPFKPGFVLMARRAGVPIQLVRIVNSRPVLGKGRAWWKMPPLPATADAIVGPCLWIGPAAEVAAAAAEVAAWFRAEPAAAGNHQWSAAFSRAEPVTPVCP